MKKTTLSRPQRFYILLLIGFILAFPKAGFKLGSLPLTWGYFFIFLTAFYLLLRKGFVCFKEYLQGYMSSIPFQVIGLMTFLSAGIASSGFFISWVISFVIFPAIFFLIFPNGLTREVKEQMFRYAKHSIFFVALYGIALFFIKYLTGKYIEIPFLTVNYQDLGTLETTKFIDRGGVFKLISTYNNGNLLGVCVLILLPLYAALEKSWVKRWVVRVALILTLSRTVWLGLVFAEGLMFWYAKEKRFKKIARFSLVLLGCILGLYTLAIWLSLPFEFFFDTLLGNRIGQVEKIYTIRLFGKDAFVGIYEMIYIGVAKSFGFFGLLAFLIAMAMPLYLHRSKAVLQNDPKSRAMRIGLLTYLFVAIADGALLLIPTMAIYWGVSLLYIDSKRSYQALEESLSLSSS